MPSYDNKVLTGDQLVYYSGLVKTALASKADSSALAGKQDELVFNTAYNASTNPVATMADISISTPIDFEDGYWEETQDNEMQLSINAITDYVLDEFYNREELEYSADLENFGQGYYINSGLTALDGIKSTIYAPNDDTLYQLGVSALGMVGEDNVNSKEVNVGISNFVWTDNSGSTPVSVSLTPGANYDGLYVNNSKVATVADITSALGGISSFSFEIVQSLPQSNISTSKIYLVEKQTVGTNQVYTEYAYVNNGWEIIGDTSMTIDTLTNSEVATIWSTATATT